MSFEEPHLSRGICDPVVLGQLLASARTWAGLHTPDAAARRVEEAVGVVIDGAHISAMEAGQRPVTFEDACMLMAAYAVPGGVNHLFDALRPPLGVQLKRAQWPLPAHKKGAE